MAHGHSRNYTTLTDATSGDVLDFLQRLHRIGLREAVTILASRNQPAVQREPAPLQDRTDRIAAARAIWRRAKQAEGTPAETYLRARGLHLPIPPSIRYARLPYGQRGREYPVLIAAVASADDRLTGILRIYLSNCGTAKASVPKPKLSLGRVAGGAIRLAPPAQQLFVTEGLEDGLTLLQERGCAVWVACGAAMLPKMIFPTVAEEVIVGGDNDPAGHEAASQAVTTYRGRGIRSRAIFPLRAKDFNAELMEGLGL